MSKTATSAPYTNCCGMDPATCDCSNPDHPQTAPANIEQSGLKEWRKAYVCDVCGKEGFWSDEWSYWGSILSSEYGHRLYACSNKCRANLKDPEKVWKRKYGCSSSARKYRHGL